MYTGVIMPIFILLLYSTPIASTCHCHCSVYALILEFVCYGLWSLPPYQFCMYIQLKDLKTGFIKYQCTLKKLLQKSTPHRVPVNIDDDIFHRPRIHFLSALAEYILCTLWCAHICLRTVILWLLLYEKRWKKLCIKYETRILHYLIKPSSFLVKRFASVWPIHVAASQYSIITASPKIYDDERRNRIDTAVW